MEEQIRILENSQQPVVNGLGAFDQYQTEPVSFPSDDEFYAKVQAMREARQS